MNRIVRQPKPLFIKNGSRCVLLLHAYTGSPNDVRMLARSLESQNFSVYAPLFTGHGTLDPKNILDQPAAQWTEDTKKAIGFLKAEGFQQIAVFGLSMGGIYAARAIQMQDKTIIGGGFFCSPIFPAETNIVENFLKYAEIMLKNAGSQTLERREKIKTYRKLLEAQLNGIDQVAASAAEELDRIQVPFFMAQAGKDEMIDAKGVFKVAEALQENRFTLQWYPESKHVITVDKHRRQFEQDVYQFLTTLPWNEE